MIIGPRRAALIAAIAAVVIVIILYPIIIFTPFDAYKVNFTLTQVTVQPDPNNDQVLNIKSTFTLSNNNTLTLTTSRIDYNLFANGSSVGENTISYEDVPVNGRPALFAGSSVPITDTLTMNYTDSNAALFKALEKSGKSTTWKATGSADIESGTSLLSRNFTTSFQ